MNSVRTQPVIERTCLAQKVILIVLIFAAAAQAGMPLLDQLVDARSIGPMTEPVDPASYHRVVYVSSTAQPGVADGTRH
ncbi:MAG TPA: hypothetical protein VNL70_10445, partial [Tepidisphaeraceae bacterium]|nr:hypothetical protein [Tepidisphaeraceae bacterium]